MKKILLMLAFAPFAGRSQSFFFENRDILKMEKEENKKKYVVEPVFHGDVFIPVGEVFSLGTYFQIEGKTGELIPMVEAKVFRHVEIGAGFGYEHPKNVRAAASLQWKTEKDNLFYFSEFLGTGYWYHAFYERKVTPRFGAGIVSQEGVGIGMRFSEKLPLHLSVWGSYCFDPGSGRTAFLVGVRYVYETEKALEYEEARVSDENR